MLHYAPDAAKAIPVKSYNAQNPLDTFPCSFHADGEDVNLLPTCNVDFSSFVSYHSLFVVHGQISVSF